MRAVEFAAGFVDIPPQLPAFFGTHRRPARRLVAIAAPHLFGKRRRHGAALGPHRLAPLALPGLRKRRRRDHRGGNENQQMAKRLHVRHSMPAAGAGL